MLCATDTIAAISPVNEQKYQALNAVLFGEGIVNDSVAILLFDVVGSLLQRRSPPEATPGFTLEASDCLLIGANFVTLALASLLIGVSAGLAAALVLKHLPLLDSAPVKETTIILVFAYLSYLLAEAFRFSGIITLFSCGFTMAHYAFHNVSIECQRGSRLLAETAASLAESFLYVYLGLSALTIERRNVLPGLVVVALLATLLARLVSVLVPFALLKAAASCAGAPSLRWNEVLLVAVGGGVRGAIAFGLAAQVRSPNAAVLVTTTQLVVLITTVFLGSSMGLVARALNIRTDDWEKPDASSFLTENLLSEAAPKKYP